MVVCCSVGLCGWMLGLAIARPRRPSASGSSRSLPLREVPGRQRLRATPSSGIENSGQFLLLCPPGTPNMRLPIGSCRVLALLLKS
jgi:hypothetical protein